MHRALRGHALRGHNLGRVDTHTHTHARMHARTHAHTHTHTQINCHGLVYKQVVDTSINNHIQFMIGLNAMCATETFRILDMTMVVSNECVIPSGDADHLQWLPAIART